MNGTAVDPRQDLKAMNCVGGVRREGKDRDLGPGCPGSGTGPATGFLRDLWHICSPGSSVLCEKLDEMLKVLSVFILTCCRNPAALRAVVAERGIGPCLPGRQEDANPGKTGIRRASPSAPPPSLL